METLLLKTKYRLIPLFYKSNKKDNLYFQIFEPTVGQIRDLHRIGISQINYINGKSRALVRIPKDKMKLFNFYQMQPFKFTPELLQYT